MYDQLQAAISPAKTILVIQAENPDGDSLGSALALEELLGDMGKKVHLFCSVDIPRHLHYVKGWDRVSDDWPSSFDLSIIVDTASATLLSKALIPEQQASLEKAPIIVLDHHATTGTLPFETISIIEPVVATGQLILNVAAALKWPINEMAAENMAIAMLSDTLGLTTQAVDAAAVHALGTLVEHGANLHDIESRRREYMKKSQEILAYKGELIGRIEYFLDGQLAVVHVPWEDIQKYSDRYNPSVLVLDEMRLVENVQLAVAIKTYPDGKVTGKLRGNLPICETVAGYFGGGGHAYSAGFRAYDDYEKIKSELITATQKAIESNEAL